jgi:hypothetical protein
MYSGEYDACGYTLRVTSQASYSPEYITPTQKNHVLVNMEIRPMKIDYHVSRPRPHGIYLPHENFSLFIIFEK